MKIFITGGTGFIGRHLVLSLIQKYSVLVLIRKEQEISINNDNLKYILGTFSNIKKWETTVKHFAPDVIIHLGWEGIPDFGMEMSLKNLKYSNSIFNLAKKIECKTLISLGSCWEYKAPKGAINENYQIDSSSIFSAVKNLIRLNGNAVSADSDMNFYWLRVFYVYGPGQKKTSLIPHIIESLKKGREPEINNLLGENDFIYIKDLVSAINLIIEKRPSKNVYNIGSGYSTKIKEIISIAKNKIDNSYVKNENTFWANINSIKKDLNWEPEYSIKEGIEETVKKENIL